MQPVHMGIGKEAIIRILGKAPLQFLHTLLHVEAGRTEGIAEDIGEKEIDGNAFRLGAANETGINAGTPFQLLDMVRYGYIRGLHPT